MRAGQDDVNVNVSFGMATAPARHPDPPRRNLEIGACALPRPATGRTPPALMATVNSSIVIISLPAIFRGIGLEPLQPGNIGFLLWMLMGYLVATSVLVVTFGRLGDMLGRVRMYNLGLLWFTIASTLLAVVPAQGPSGALTLIGRASC